MKAHLRGVRISPKKTNIVAGLIRKKPVNEALDMLQFIPNKAALPLRKCLKSAVANAETNDGKKAVDLVVETVIVNKGAKLRRFLPSARGRALPIRKPLTHISIHLS